MRELALFAGIGGGILGGQRLGWQTVCAVEIDPYASSILVQRQNDGLLHPFPVWDDIRTFNGTPWRGLIDVVSGGFPCQDISAAKGKGALGIAGSRSGLWREMARIIDEVRPKQVFVENSPMLVGRGLIRVLGDLAEMGFDAVWGVVGAHNAGAPHKRERIWVLAKKRRIPSKHMATQTAVANTDGFRYTQPRRISLPLDPKTDRTAQTSASIAGRQHPKWPSEPDVGRVADGVSARMDRLKALGNAQVPQVVELAYTILNKTIK